MNTLVSLMELHKDLHFETQEQKNEALLNACRNRNKFFVQRLLLANANVECRDAHRVTPLTICAANGFLDIARLLIHHGANVNTVNNNGDSALSLAVGKSCSTDMVQLLLQQKSINIVHKSMNGSSSLMTAVVTLDFDLIRLILEKMFSSGDKYLYENSVAEATCLAMDCGIEKIFQYIEQEVSRNWPALHSAVTQKDLESLKFLLDYGIIKVDKDSFETFFVNILKFYPKSEFDIGDADLAIVEIILDYGKNVLFRSVNDTSILAQGVNIGNIKLLDLLCRYISYNASVDVAESEFSFGLKACAMVSRCDLLAVLLKYKSNLVNTNSNTLSLDQALISGSIGFLNMFWESGITLNTRPRFCMITCIIHSQIHSLNFILEKLSQETELIIKDSASGIFHKAVEVGDILVIERLIQAGADVNGIFERKTPLMCVTSCQVAEALFQHGAQISINHGEDRVNAIFHLFSREYRHHMRESVFHRNGRTRESINMCKQLLKDLINLFLRKGAHIEDKDDAGRTVLMIASDKKETEDIFGYLLQCGADPDNLDNKGATALHYAVRGNCINNVKTLLSFKANVNAKCHMGMSSLSESIQLNDLKMIKLLLSRGADVNAEDNEGNTPMAYAARIHDTKPETLKCLLDSGADLNHQNRSGCTPLMIAASFFQTKKIQILCDLGADVNICNYNTESALEIMVDQCNVQPRYVRKDLLGASLALLKRGASAEGVSAKHLTGLIFNGEYRLLQMLIDSGASPSELDAEQSYFLTRQLHYSEINTLSPFRFALFANKSAVAEYFLKINFLTDRDAFQRDWVGTLRQGLINFNFNCTNAIKVLDEFLSKPMPLETMCLIKVSSAVRQGTGRKSKVKSLPLPVSLQNELLFQTDLSVETKVVDNDSSSDNDDYINYNCFYYDCD